jgi:hypothetical protein
MSEKSLNGSIIEMLSVCGKKKGLFENDQKVRSVHIKVFAIRLQKKKK